MDRRNVHAQSSSYVGLLYSQQGSVAREDFPYENFHSSVHLGESENPPFSSQNSVDTPVPTPVTTPRKVVRLEHGFEFFLGVMVVVIFLIGVLLMLK